MTAHDGLGSVRADRRKDAAERATRPEPRGVDVAEGRSVVAAMTSGPWREYHDGVVGFTEPGTGLLPTKISDGDASQRLHDAHGIAWLRNNAAALLDAAEERERLRVRLDQTERSATAHAAAHIAMADSRDAALARESKLREAIGHITDAIRGDDDPTWICDRLRALLSPEDQS